MPIDGTNIICHIKRFGRMVEILCPHCEGEIELDDDASGEFECPLCGGEFEWNMDGDDSYEANTYSDDVIITTEFREMSAVPKVAGIAFCVWMVLVIGMGLMAMIGGLMLNSAESELGTGTSFGAIFVLISIVVLVIGGAGMVFGIKVAKDEDFMSLIVITIISGVLLLFNIFGFEDAADIPMLIIASGFVIGNMCCIFVPILKAQFTGVLVTRDSSVPRKSMANEFDKTKPIHPFEWVGHALSIASLIVIIICLTSSSLYTVTITEEIFEGSDSSIEIIMGMGEPNFGVFSMFLDTGSYGEIVSQMESDYELDCVQDSSSYCSDLEEELDYWKGWRTSTLILKIIVIISLVVAIVGIISRIAALLANFGAINFPDKGYILNDNIRKFSPFVSSILMFIGIILFMIMQPGTGPDGFWGEDVDGSFGFVIWFVLLYSIIVPIVSKFEVDFS